jgi:outer membrane protein with beta-barrel domain
MPLTQPGNGDKFKVRQLRVYLPTLLLMSAAVPLSNAQSAFDLNVGFGTARVGSNGSGIDNLNSPNAFGACLPNSGDTNCQATPGLRGFQLGLGGDIFLNKHFGIGAEVNLQPSKNDYGSLQFRQTFYDFNGIFAPVNQKRVQFQLQGGIGGARTAFSFTDTSCVGTAVCSTSTQPVGNVNHFQLHAGAGVQLYLTDHLFIRPQFDLHYVPNFTQQFGSNVVPQGTVWVGYSFGDRP